MLRRIAIAVLLVATAPAFAADRTVSGTIAGYECGDNCYLTIRTAKGEELTGLCFAKACEPWNEVAEMPRKYLGKRIEARVGTGQQIDGSGNVMGEMDAFTSITFK